MIEKTKGIVLQRFKYSDSSMIVNIFTEKFGKQAYLIYNSKSKKQKNTNNLLQPMFILDMQVYNKENANLQKIKEFNTTIPLTTIPFNIYKNTIAIFLAEFLNKTIKENEADETLFKFIENAISILDLTSNSIANFHISFLLQLSKFLGIQPENNYNEAKKIFDMRAGKFIVGRPMHKDFLNEEESLNLNLAFSFTLNNTVKTALNHYSRTNLLNKIIEYYKIHLDRPHNIKSLDIFKEIFI